MSHRTPRRPAFTLVELLVVIGIIALLISILLPSLGKARKAANTVKDLSNLRSLTQAMIIYTTQYKGYLPGSPLTTGVGITDSNSPSVNSAFDWASPLMDIMGYHVPYSPTADIGRSNTQAKWDRAKFQLNSQLLTDPDNAVVAPMFKASSSFAGVAGALTVQPFMSYSASMMMLVGNSSTGAPLTSDTKDPSLQHPMGNAYQNPPPGYAPKLTKIGAAEKKCFLSDGARYVKPGTAIDMDFSANGPVGGVYADWGASSNHSFAHDRTSVKVNGGATPDLRLAWARHGNGVNQFRFNMSFFDGHAETMSDFDGSNPVYWAPKGTTLAAGELWVDTATRFGASSGAYVVQE